MSSLQKEYARKKCWGMVASVDLYGCDPKLISRPAPIKKFIVQLCREIGMQRHGPALVERFAEGALEGYSAMQFIETSSITLHFDETENRAFIDIFSCKYFDYRRAMRFCKAFFLARRAKVFYFFRA